MNDMPNVSFVIPAKNEEKRLPKCLESINSLEYNNENIEVIVVDNGSEDQTTKSAKAFGAKVLVRPYDTVAGLRNFGAKASCGHLLIFIDSDIELKPLFIKNSLKHFEEPSTGIVTGPILIPKTATWVEKTWCLNRTTRDKVQELEWSSSMNMIVRRDTFFIINGFTEDLITFEDIDLCMRLKNKNHRIIYDPQVEVIHFGEAKTLRDLFYKELWRGISSIQFVKTYPLNCKRVISFLQIPFFLLSSVIFILSVLFSVHRTILLATFFLAVFLPLSRALLICVKTNTIKHIIKLFVVWYTYYTARSVALIANCGRSNSKYKKLRIL